MRNNQRCRVHHLIVLMVVLFILACPDGDTITVHISGVMDSLTIGETRTWALGQRTAINRPTRFDLKIWASDALYLSNPPDSQDDILAWVILSDPFGGRSDVYIPFTLSFAGDGWYSGSVVKSVQEWIGPEGQLQPAEWSVRVTKKIIGVQLQVECDVHFAPYQPSKTNIE